MIQKVQIPISVDLTYDSKLRKSIPRRVVWEGRVHKITKIGMHHPFREGRTLYHIFSVESPTLFFRLKLNTENLQWSLEEISDGEPD